MKGRKADGGKVMPQKEPKPYNAQGSEVEKEAEKKKRGGRAGHVDGGKASARMDRPGRKRGGRAMADKAPLTTASKITSAEAHKTSDDGDADEGP